MRKWLFGFALALSLGVWRTVSAPSSTNEQSPTAVEVADAYKTYPQITKGEVFVNPELARLCVGANQKQVEAAREKHGPHANTAVVIYMNDPAAETFRAKRVAYPPGSVIVKQKRVGSHRTEDGKWENDGCDGVGGMIKRTAGYDPEHGDWEYFYFDQFVPPVVLTRSGAEKSARRIETGRIASCVQCHDAAKRTDYVFGSWAHPDNPFAIPTQIKLR